MRRFNPEKELRKIQKGNKNKVIIGVIVLLLIIAIGSSYALYQIRYNKQIIYTTVAPFYSKDLQLAVYVDGVRQEEFPEKSEDMLYGGYECEKDSKITLNDDWSITLKTNKPDKCNIRFGKKYKDESGANYPELYQGMIPVYFKEGKIYIADITNEWYNYDNNEWANAVLIDYENKKDKFYDENNNLLGGHEVKEEDILQMYVWIPRYKYELFNVDNQGVPKQIINIEFEEGISNTGNIKCIYTNNGDGTITEDCKDKKTQEPVKNTDWYTHPAFTFKGTTDIEGTELPGIWIGKFEPSDPDDLTGRQFVINEITILPDKTSMVSKKTNSVFDAVRAIENNNKYNLKTEEVDTHMMKNIEWGAVAYLSQSVYGIYKAEKTCGIDGMQFSECKIYRNNVAQGAGTEGVTDIFGGIATGCVSNKTGDAVEWNKNDKSPAVCPEGRSWEQSGVKASTTGNMYGIYDMSGGSYEYIMGSIVTTSGSIFYTSSMGFNDMNLPNSKYYDLYSYSTNEYDYSRGHLGDATRETLSNTNAANDNGWNRNYSLFPYSSSTGDNVLFMRGASYENSPVLAGIFSFLTTQGGISRISSFRVVLTAQDGNE